MLLLADVDWYLVTCASAVLLPPSRRLCNARRLSVCLLSSLRKNYWTDLHENFTTNVSLNKEVTIKFLEVIWIQSRGDGVCIRIRTRLALVEVCAVWVLLFLVCLCRLSVCLCQKLQLLIANWSNSVDVYATWWTLKLVRFGLHLTLTFDLQSCFYVFYISKLPQTNYCLNVAAVLLVFVNGEWSGSHFAIRNRFSSVDSGRMPVSGSVYDID